MTEEKEIDCIVNPEWENAPYELSLIDDITGKRFPFPNDVDPSRLDSNLKPIPKYIPRPKSSDADLRILPPNPNRKYLIPIIHKRPIE